MAKDKTMYVCENCGQESAKWIGKCPSCGQWNTFKEIKVSASNSSSPKLGEVRRGLNKGTGIQSSAAGTGRVLRLKDISAHDDPRIDMHDEELNRVLGGGLVPGSIVLLGGGGAIFMLKNKGKGGKNRADNDFVLDDDDDEPDEEEPNQE